MKCPQCGQICRTKREYCALCGAPLKRKPWRMILTIVILILVLAILGLIAYQQFRDAASESAAEPIRQAEPAPTPEPVRTPEPAPEAEAAEPEETAVQPEPEPEELYPQDAMWPDCARIYARDSYTLALTRDGHVRVAGRPDSPEFGFDMFSWDDIRQLVPTDKFVAALTGDGQVLLSGETIGFESAAQWQDVAGLWFSGGSLVGLTQDGLVLAVGPDMKNDLSRFKNIVRVIPSRSDTVLISEDGKPAVLRGQNKMWDASGNKGMADAVSNSLCAVYLMEDGTVNPGASFWNIQAMGHFRCSFAGWKDVKELLLGEECILGLTNDGRVLSAKCLSAFPVPDTSSWTGVVQMAYDEQRKIAYGVTEDGRILAAAAGDAALPEIDSWENVRELQINDSYVVALTKDGRVLVWAWPEAPAPLDVSSWEDVDSIALAGGHLVGLRSDGWVLAAGANDCGQCGER